MFVQFSSISGRLRALILFLCIISCFVLCLYPSLGFAADSNGTGYEVTNAVSNFGSHIMEDVARKFQIATQSWGAAFTTAGERLFWLLVPIALVWRMGKKALSGGGGIEVLADFTQFCIFIGFFFWLLHDGYNIAGTILSSMRQLSGEASGFQTALKPSDILNIGFNVLNKTIAAFGQTSWKEIPAGLCFIITGVIFLIISGLTALNMLMALISMWVLMYVGVFILGFGATQWTSEMAIGYFRSVFSASLRIAGMILVVGICENIINQYSQSFQQTNIGIQDAATMLLIGVVMFILSSKVPDMLASLPQGSSGHHGGALSGGQALAGLAAAGAMAATAAKITATAATGGASAGIGALQAAVTAGREAKQDRMADNFMSSDVSDAASAGTGDNAGRATNNDNTPSQNAPQDAGSSRSQTKGMGGHLVQGVKGIAQQKLDQMGERISRTMGGQMSSNIQETARTIRAGNIESHIIQQAIGAGHSQAMADEAGMAASSIIRSGGSVQQAQTAAERILGSGETAENGGESANTNTMSGS